MNKYFYTYIPLWGGFMKLNTNDISIKHYGSRKPYNKYLDLWPAL